MGAYPAIGLKEARDAAKRRLAKGRDPSVAKQAGRLAKGAGDTKIFDSIAGERLDKKRRERKAERAIAKFEWFMSVARPAILRPIEARGNVDAAKKLGALKGGIAALIVTHRAAITEPMGFGALLRVIAG